MEEEKSHMITGIHDSSVQWIRESDSALGPLYFKCGLVINGPPVVRDAILL